MKKRNKTMESRPGAKSLGLILIVGAVLLAGVIFPPAGLASAYPLYVGWDSQNITPDEPVILRGQAHRRIATEAADSITCTALAMETRSGDETMEHTIMISVDLLGIPRPVQSKIRKAIRQELPEIDTSKVVVSATHTHAAPYMGQGNIQEVPEEGVMKPEEYVTFLTERVTTAAVNAWRFRKRGGYSWGLGHAAIGQNRRMHYVDGTTRMYGSTSRSDFDGMEGPEEHTLGMVFFWNEQGRLTGILINVSCPAQVSEQWRSITADYWHEVRERVHDRFGEEVSVFPQIGAAGDISPHLQYRRTAEREMRRRMGLDSRRDQIAHRIVREVEEAYQFVWQPVAETELDHRVKNVELKKLPISENEYREAKKEYDKLRSQDFDEGSRKYRWMRRYESVIWRYQMQYVDPTIPVEIHTIRLGDVAVVTNPFELYVDYGIRIKARSEATLTLISEITGDFQFYVPTRNALHGGGYSAEVTSSIVGPEGGDHLVEHSVQEIRNMVVGTAEEPVVPEKFSLSQNYPNPFNPGTRIEFTLPKDSQVNLSVYNLRGQAVATLVHERRRAGEYTVQWDGISKSGQQVASGVYIYRLQMAEGERTLRKKMVLIR